MKYKMANLIDCIGHYVFDEKYGLVRVYHQGLVITASDKNEYSSDNIFMPRSNQYISLNDYCNVLTFFKENEWESMTFYVKKPNHNSYYLGYCHVLQKDQVKEVTIKKIKWVVIYKIITNPEMLGNFDKVEEVSFEFETQKELLTEKFICFEKIKSKDLKIPYIEDIQVGNEYWLVSNGKVKVIQLYDYPSKNNLICKVKDSQKVEKDVSIYLEKLYLLPYLDYKNPLEVLDKNINEILLQPAVDVEGKIYNVYWKAVADAASYQVSIYKIILKNGVKDLYHIQDIVVDRNTCFLAIDNLIGGSFVFKVSAESRNGEILALSRGMVNGFPQYFVEEE